MTLAALLLAVAALAYAFLTQRKLGDVQQRLNRASSHIYELDSRMTELSEQLEATGKQLSFEIRQASGSVKFEPNTTIGEVTAQHPMGEAILASFHMGGCHSCAVEPSETIRDATNRLGVNETALLAALRNGGNGAMMLRPNIELQ